MPYNNFGRRAQQTHKEESEDEEGDAAMAAEGAEEHEPLRFGATGL